MRVADSDSARWNEATRCLKAGDFPKALSIWTELDRDGEHYASTEIGHLYEVGGLGVPRNYEEAAKWYRKAVFALDDPDAHLALARMLFNRQLQGDDAAEAFSRHALAAAERGKSMGWLLLGLAYAGGRLGIVDKTKAAFYYERAASEGMILAERRLVRLAMDSHRYFAAAKLYLHSYFKSVRIAIRNPADPRLAGISPEETSLAFTRSDANAIYRCPCCGYRTLRERGQHEICKVCFWQDDGQDDHDADEVRGGPNKNLSLTQARANYRAFGAVAEAV